MTTLRTLLARTALALLLAGASAPGPGGAYALHWDGVDDGASEAADDNNDLPGSARRRRCDPEASDDPCNVPAPSPITIVIVDDELDPQPTPGPSPPPTRPGDVVPGEPVPTVIPFKEATDSPTGWRDRASDVPTPRKMTGFPTEGPEDDETSGPTSKPSDPPASTLPDPPATNPTPTPSWDNDVPNIQGPTWGGSTSTIPENVEDQVTLSGSKGGSKKGGPSSTSKDRDVIPEGVKHSFTITGGKKGGYPSPDVDKNGFEDTSTFNGSKKGGSAAIKDVTPTNGDVSKLNGSKKGGTSTFTHAASFDGDVSTFNGSKKGGSPPNDVNPTYGDVSTFNGSKKGGPSPPMDMNPAGYGDVFSFNGSKKGGSPSTENVNPTYGDVFTSNGSKKGALPPPQDVHPTYADDVSKLNGSKKGGTSTFTHAASFDGDVSTFNGSKKGGSPPKDVNPAYGGDVFLFNGSKKGGSTGYGDVFTINGSKKGGSPDKDYGSKKGGYPSPDVDKNGFEDTSTFNGSKKGGSTTIKDVTPTKVDVATINGSKKETESTTSFSNNGWGSSSQMPKDVPVSGGNMTQKDESSTNSDATAPATLKVNDDHVTGLKNEDIVIPVLANDEVPDDAGGSFTSPQHGHISKPSMDGLVYTPEQDWCGTDSFEYTVTSGELSESANVTIEIECPPSIASARAALPPSEPMPRTTLLPRAIAIDKRTGMDSPVSIQLGSLFDLEHLDFAVAYVPMNGVLEMGDESSIVYKPNAGFVGNEVLEYSLCTMAEPIMCDDSTITIVIDPIVTENSPWSAAGQWMVEQETHPLDSQISDEEGKQSVSTLKLAMGIGGGVLAVALAVAGILYTIRRDRSQYTVSEGALLEDTSSVGRGNLSVTAFLSGGDSDKNENIRDVVDL